MVRESCAQARSHAVMQEASSVSEARGRPPRPELECSFCVELLIVHARTATAQETKGGKRRHFALFWSFWLAISEPGWTSQKKFHLESGLNQRDQAKSRKRYVGSFPGARSKTSTWGVPGEEVTMEVTTKKTFRFLGCSGVRSAWF